MILCKDCIYQKDGQCHRYAPHPIRHTKIKAKAFWPAVTETDGCAEGVAKTQQVQPNVPDVRVEDCRDNAPKRNFLICKDGMEAIPDEAFARWAKAYKNIDVKQEFEKAASWAIDNPSKRKTKRGALRFLNGWMSRADDRAKNPTMQDTFASAPWGTEVPDDA